MQNRKEWFDFFVLIVFIVSFIYAVWIHNILAGGYAGTIIYYLLFLREKYD